MKHTYSQAIENYCVILSIYYFFLCILGKIRHGEKDSIRKHIFLTEMIILSAATIF